MSSNHLEFETMYKVYKPIDSVGYQFMFFPKDKMTSSFKEIKTMFSYQVGDRATATSPFSDLEL
jgi:hypothetical protein